MKVVKLNWNISKIRCSDVGMVLEKMLMCFWMEPVLFKVRRL